MYFFFRKVYFLAQRIRYFSLFCPILAILSQCYALFGELVQAEIMRWCTKIDKYQVWMNSRSHFFHRFTSARLPWFSFSMFYRAKQHHQPERSGKKRGAICWKYLLWQSFVTSPVVGKTRRNFSPAGQQPARHLHLADEPPMFLCLVIGKEFAQIFVAFFSHQ